MELQDYSRDLNVLDQVRIRPYKKEILKKELKFKYFATLDYPTRIFNYNKVISDNRILKEESRSFFGEKVKSLWFIEKHTGNGAFAGAYHRHLLLEDVPLTSRSVQSYLLRSDPEALFAVQMCGEISDESKIRLLEYFFSSSKQTANSHRGVRVLKIQSNFDRVLAYCTKQNERFHPAYEVLDPTSSDIDASYLLQYKQDGTEWKTRPLELSARPRRNLRYAIV
tara:strand:- start:415 stop:1086 length:672 start_codon:yes stop_codon:yes gene_type:complete